MRQDLSPLVRGMSRYAGADTLAVATVAFLVWYLLYVVMSSWATDFMNIKLFGNINVALVFGLLQFVTTFLIAWLYSKHSTKHLDPLANKLRDEFDKGIHS